MNEVEFEEVSLIYFNFVNKLGKEICGTIEEHTNPKYFTICIEGATFEAYSKEEAKQFVKEYALK